VVVTGLLFGFDVWLLFWTETRPLMTSILEAPFPQDYQVNATTFFILARSLGLGLTASYSLQMIVSIVAIATTLWLWRGRTAIEHRSKVCLTILLTLFATPYGYSYDTIPLNVAIAYFFFNYRGLLAPLGVAWLYPLYNQQFARSLLPFGALIPAALAAWVLIRVLWDQHSLGGDMATADEESPVKAS